MEDCEVTVIRVHFVKFPKINKNIMIIMKIINFKRNLYKEKEMEVAVRREL